MGQLDVQLATSRVGARKSMYMQVVGGIKEGHAMAVFSRNIDFFENLPLTCLVLASRCVRTIMC